MNLQLKPIGNKFSSVQLTTHFAYFRSTSPQAPRSPRVGERHMSKSVDRYVEYRWVEIKPISVMPNIVTNQSDVGFKTRWEKKRRENSGMMNQWISLLHTPFFFFFFLSFYFSFTLFVHVGFDSFYFLTLLLSRPDAKQNFSGLFSVAWHFLDALLFSKLDFSVIFRRIVTC